MSVTLTILCENSVSRPGELIGEHGFSCLIEVGTQRWLFDTGQGLGLLNNAREMRVDLNGLSGVILSHGHYDHSGGLLPLLRSVREPLKIYAHPDVFLDRFWRSDHETRDIGIPVNQESLVNAGAIFSLSRKFQWLDDSVCLSGEISRQTSFEVGDEHLVIEDDLGFIQDPLWDDQSLAIKTEKGLIVVLGCAHAGVINILDYFIEKIGDDRILLLVGGTHLGPADEHQYLATITALRRYRIFRFAFSHCTGLSRSAQLLAEFPGRCSFASVGTVFRYG